MKDESQQQVPPGIVAFKNKRTGAIFDYDDTEEFYKQWCEYRMEEPDNTIHTISVDGKEWSCQENVSAGGEQFKIKSFLWNDTSNYWDAIMEGKPIRHERVYNLSKLPPATETEDDSYKVAWFEWRSNFNEEPNSAEAWEAAIKYERARLKQTNP